MTANYNGGSSRNADLIIMKSAEFKQGVADLLAGWPPQQDNIYYEFGRLFAARYKALGEEMPPLPRRGDCKRSKFRPAVLAFHTALFVDDTFPWSQVR